jgi:hypothetical protein
MVMFQIILYLVILVTSLPVGLFLAWLCDDELIKDRKYFLLLSYFLLVVSIFLFFFYFKISLLLAILYMILVLWVLVRRGRKLEKSIKLKRIK